MNTPSPLTPPGSLQPNHSRGKSTLRIAVFLVVAIHALFFTGLLMQGCNRNGKSPDTAATNSIPTNELSKLDRDYYTNFTEVPTIATNVPATNDLAAASNRMTLPTTPTPTLPITPAPATPKTSEPKEYTVAKGDTLAKIAKAQGVTLTELTKANPAAEPTKLKIGQKLQIPAPAAPAATTAPAATGPGFVEPGSGEAAKLHVVKSGETLTTIAKQHGTTVTALKATNSLRTDRLHVGDKLKLPAPKTPAARATNRPPAASLPLPASTTIDRLNMLPAGTSLTNR